MAKSLTVTPTTTGKKKKPESKVRAALRIATTGIFDEEELEEMSRKILTGQGAAGTVPLAIAKNVKRRIADRRKKNEK